MDTEEEEGDGEGENMENKWKDDEGIQVKLICRLTLKPFESKKKTRGKRRYHGLPCGGDCPPSVSWWPSLRAVDHGDAVDLCSRKSL